MMQSNPITRPTEQEMPLASSRWWSLAVLLSATFMVILDSFIVNVAAPSIQRELAASPSQLQFILAGYVLAYAVLLITGGRLGDRYGGRRLFVVGMAGFVLTSAACGMAGSATQLIAARLLQGSTAAIMVPQVMAMIQTMFPPAERQRAIGWYGAVSGLAVVAGQIAGGMLLEADVFGLGWRSVFLINLPIGLVALLLASVLLPKSTVLRQTRLDLTGIVLSATGLAALTYPLVIGQEAGWPWWSIAIAACSVLVFAAFVRHERRLTDQGGYPLMPTSLFGLRSFRGGVTAILLYQTGNAGSFLVLALFMQEARGFSALEASLAFLFLGLGFFLASMFGAKLYRRVGFVALRWGAILMAVGYALILLAAQVSDESLKWTLLAAPMLAAGIGQGLAGPLLFMTALTGIPRSDAGAASGVVSTMMQTSNVLGIAIMGSLYFALSAGDAERAFVIALGASLALAAGLYALLLRMGRAERLKQPD